MSKYHITEEQFINPYNFVSINEPVERDMVMYGELSGTITCELKTLTPLFIPNTSKDCAFSTAYSHSYDFFSCEDLNERSDYLQLPARPIIPGASIRGVIRSAFEAVTNGCMSTCDDDNTLYRRTPVPRKFYGIIEKDESTGERILYKATKWKWSVRDRANHQTGDTLRGGVYLRGENFHGKKSDAIMKYELTENGEKIELGRFSEESREWTNLVEVWRLYQPRGGKIKGVNQSNDGYQGYLSAKLIPVYYTKLDDSDFYYFGPAAITKEVFSRTLSELLERQGGHNPCQKRASLCYTCNLFGMVGEEAQASRLFFRDATPAAPDGASDWSNWYEEVRALPILASPKVSATEFYMEDVQGADYFNYDYIVNYFDYFDENGKSESAPVRAFLDNPKLRGRKFYWHRKSIVYDTTSGFSKQRMEIRPILAEKTFHFEIGFDRLTKTELETLIWVLTFGEHNETNAHKLGHAKPYGYGSVRITKANVATLTLNNDLSIDKATSTEYTPQSPNDSIALREYLKLTNFVEANEDIKYPEGDNGRRTNSRGVYQWFGINKEIRTKAFQPSFNYVLPKPLDENIKLPGYVSGDGNIGGNRAEIRKADKPEAQSDIKIPEKQEEKGTTIGGALEQQSTEKVAIAEPQYGTYDAKKLDTWLLPRRRVPKEMKSLRSFVDDFERAEVEGDKRYEGLVSKYKNAKKKLNDV